MEQIPHEDSEEFLMYYYKIYPCSKRYSHPWLECGFSHPNERATRRDPRVYSYSGIACVEMKKMGACPRGDACPYAHSVFEYWLHPTRYRTQMCAEGPTCTRKFCFFAHSELELRHIPSCKPLATSPDRQSAHALAAAALPLVRSTHDPTAALMLDSYTAVGLPGAAGWGSSRPAAGRGSTARRAAFSSQGRHHGPARDHTKPLRRASDTAMLAPAVAQQLLQQLPVDTLNLLTSELAASSQGFPTSTTMQQAVLQQLVAAGLAGAAPGAVPDLNIALALQLLQQAAASSSPLAAQMQQLPLLGPLAAPMLQMQQMAAPYTLPTSGPDGTAAASSSSGTVEELAGILQQMQIGKQAAPGQGASPGMDQQLQMQNLLQMLSQQNPAALQQAVMLLQQQQQQQQQQQPMTSSATPVSQGLPLSGPQLLNSINVPSSSAAAPAAAAPPTPPGSTPAVTNLLALMSQQTLTQHTASSRHQPQASSPMLHDLATQQQQQQQQQQLAGLLNGLSPSQQQQLNLLDSTTMLQASQAHSIPRLPSEGANSLGSVGSGMAQLSSLAEAPGGSSLQLTADSSTSTPTSLSSPSGSNLASGSNLIAAAAAAAQAQADLEGYLSAGSPPAAEAASLGLMQLLKNRA